MGKNICKDCLLTVMFIEFVEVIRAGVQELEEEAGWQEEKMSKDIC